MKITHLLFSMTGIVLLAAFLVACDDSSSGNITGSDEDVETSGDLDDEDEGEQEEEEAPPVIAFSITADSHCVQVDEGASASETTAAEELRSTLTEILGSEQPFCDADEASQRAKIIVGMGASAEAVEANPSLEELGEQGYLLRTVPPHLVIAGTPGAGTMYGVHRFLESVAGVRWYAPGVTHIPSLTEIRCRKAMPSSSPRFSGAMFHTTGPARTRRFIHT